MVHRPACPSLACVGQRCTTPLPLKTPLPASRTTHTSPSLPQAPIFIYASASVRSMAAHSWPGFAHGGLAWFTDLRLPAYVWASGALPMGPQGLLLPALVTGATLLSIRIGLQASGVLWLGAGLTGGEARKLDVGHGALAVICHTLGWQGGYMAHFVTCDHLPHPAASQAATTCTQPPLTTACTSHNPSMLVSRAAARTQAHAHAACRG